VYQKLSIAIVLTLATSSQGLLTTASKENGIYTYNFATVPFLAEVIKLVRLHILVIYLKVYFSLDYFKCATLLSGDNRSKRSSNHSRLAKYIDVSNSKPNISRTQ